MSHAAAVRRRPTRQRLASSRYVNMAASPTGLGVAGGERAAIGGLADVVDRAGQLAGGHEAIVWVHPSCHAPWGLPDRLGAAHLEFVADLSERDCRVRGDTGWVIFDGPPKVHLAFPSYSGDFRRLDDAATLLGAVEAFRQALGLAYVISAPKTVHTLIGNTCTLEETEAEPVDPARVRSAWALPANHWHLEELATLQAAGCRWVRCFDQTAAYLAAWQSCTLPMGGWTRIGPGTLDPGAESGKPAGYWLFDPDALPQGLGTFDPWRQHGDPGGPRWVTTPLAQLACDIAGQGVPYVAAVLADERRRTLDPAVSRLRDAWATLTATPGVAAKAALAVLKEGYSAGTSWFGGGPRPPDPLARPCWMHTIHDRRAANLWRALDGATPGPWAVAEIDTALFALRDADETPAGLRMDGGLASWKPKGPPLPIDAAANALASGGLRGVLALAEGKAN